MVRELTCKLYELTKKPRFVRDFGLKGQIQKTILNWSRDTKEIDVGQPKIARSTLVR